MRNPIKTEKFRILVTALALFIAGALLSLFFINKKIDSENSEKAQNPLKVSFGKASSKISYKIDNLLIQQKNSAQAIVHFNDKSGKIDKAELKLFLNDLMNNDPDFLKIFFIDDDIVESKIDTLSFNLIRDTSQIIIPKFTRFNNSVKYENAENFQSEIDMTVYSKVRLNLNQSCAEGNDNFNKGEQYLKVFTPVFEGDRFIGLLGAYISLESVKEILNKENVYNKSINFILNSENKNIIFFSGKKWISGKNIEKYDGPEKSIYEDLVFSEAENSNYYKVYQNIKLGESETKWELFAYTPKNVFQEDSGTEKISIILTSLFFLLISFAVILIVINRNFSILKEIDFLIQDLQKGKTHKIADTTKTGELGSVYNSIVLVNNYISNVSQICYRIAAGQYDNKIEPKNKEDVLAISVNSIIESIEKHLEQEKEQKKEAEIQLWHRIGRFEIAKVQRLSSQEVETLSFNLIRQLVNYVDATLGGIYILINQDNKTVLKNVAAYAYQSRKLLENKTFALGEGLIGTCAAEKTKIFIKKIPENYLQVASGLGSAPPKSLLILPVNNDKDLVAVMEVAFYNQPELYKIEFIEQLTDNIGSWLYAAEKHALTEELLEKSKKQAEELFEKEKLLNSNIEHLEELREREKENAVKMKGMLDAVNNTIMTVEYTTDGVLLNANKAYLKTMARDIDQIKGVDVGQLVKDKKKEFLEIMEKVKNGENVKQLIQRYSGDGSARWLNASYNPYYDENGKITKVLFFAVDVTQDKLEKESLIKENNLLKQKLSKYETDQL